MSSKVEKLIQALGLDPEQVSEEDRELLGKSLEAFDDAEDTDDAKDGDEAEAGSEDEAPEDGEAILARFGKTFLSAMLDKGNDFDRMGQLFRALAADDDDEEDDEGFDDEPGDEEFGELEGNDSDDSGKGEPSDEELDSEVAEILGDDEAGDEEEEEEADRLKRTRKSLTEAVEDAGIAGDTDVQFVDPDELVSQLSKSVTDAMDERLKPLQDEIGELRKSIETLEQQPASSHPYAVMEKAFDSEDGGSSAINRAQVVQVTQDALTRGVNGFTLNDATNMQKAVGTENWTQYDAQFKELVRDLKALDTEG